MTPLRVMIVHEQPLTRAAGRATLAGSEIEIVAEATCAADAATLGGTTTPDLVLVDIDLLDDSAIALIHSVVMRVPDAATVVLSGSSATYDLFRAIDAGARGYLLKGLSNSALRRALLAAARGELAMPRSLAAEMINKAAGAGGHDALESMRTLSPRELEVLPLLADALTDHEIAEILAVSPRTVEAHVASILRKLGARNRVGAAGAYFRQHG